MKLHATWVLLFACTSSAAWAELRLLPELEPALLFGGQAQDLCLRWQNDDARCYEQMIVARVLQVSSSTAVKIGDYPWKTIQALPGQTILESAPIEFPAVNAETGFLVQWIGGSHVLGHTRVLAYPTNLLRELKPLLGGADLGVLDPMGAFKLSFHQNEVVFVDLGQKVLEEFSGRLALVGPFPSRAQMRPSLAVAIRKLARRGTAVVWFQPPPVSREPITPSFYIVSEGRAVVVVAKADLVANFSENPQAQLNLIHLCKLALNPAPWPLPDLALQP